MGRKCLFRWCKSSGALHSFPPDAARARLWLRAVGWPSTTDTSNMFVCNKHFSRESYENWRMVDFGLAHQRSLRLLSNAVPNPEDFSVPSKEETVRGLSLISQDFNSEVSEEEMDHCYASTAETIQALSKKRKRTDVKRERDRLRQKNRVNIGEEYSRWKALKVEKGMKNDMEVACYLLDRVCGEHLSQDNSSESPRKRGKRQKSTSALKSEQTRSDSPQPSPDLQSTNVEVLGICYDVPPLWLYQPDKQAQPERLLEDGSDPDVRMGYNKEQNCMMEQSSSSSTTTEEDHTVLWEKRKDELTQTALRLEERLNAMRSLSDTASDPISLTRGIADQKERKWVVNKSSLTGLFRTCHQCGEPVLEFKTLTSGSLIRIQWECSKGHLMWLFPNHNPT
ncbi:uncharacterized protein LOC107677180 isoform X3 [Sinocyclocheilus anshuiensis]|uniref:uncharacterized protein LOC107677180 isoform X3 n=1 Tax=Sinocyclocheilus anshuiensis TaxID=1608454 RepID=UPI0007B8D5FA|nr:PREDICTED: uncharacterized protein LOC107677180 isoform X3 [Sinocyclocheilus anshuiensis]